MPCVNAMLVKEPSLCDVKGVFSNISLTNFPCEVRFVFFISITNVPKGKHLLKIFITPPMEERYIQETVKFEHDKDDCQEFTRILPIYFYAKKPGTVLVDITLDEEQFSIFHFQVKKGTC